MWDSPMHLLVIALLLFVCLPLVPFVLICRWLWRKGK
jgi:hypothetical protein